MTEPTTDQLAVMGGIISGHHCARSQERYERDVKAGTWKPTGVPTNYEGIPLHIASSAVDRLNYLRTMKET